MTSQKRLQARHAKRATIKKSRATERKTVGLMQRIIKGQRREN